MDSTSYKGFILIIVATFLFSSHDTISKYLTSAYPVLLIVWARYAVHTALMASLFLPKAGTALFKTANLKLQLLRGGCLVATSLFFTFSLHYLPLAEATSIHFLAPLLVILLSVLLLGERVSARQMCAALAGFVGTLFIVRPGGDLFTLAVLLPFCSALCFALYQLLTRKLSAYDSAITSNFLGGFFAAGVTSLLVPFFWVTPTMKDAIMMGALGTLGMISHLLFSQSFRYAAPAVLAPFSYCQILFSTIMGAFIFKQVPESLSLYGMVVIAISGALALLKGSKAA
ncbi:DMT family transporter [Pseudomonas sp. CBS]|uniref:DMT family transporter n=1 Tax=Pseudomonas sp. CBS TaxID=2971912 RepID=UPI002814A835|nr:DMT family transporter [Pseudomonas sp. CBS]